MLNALKYKILKTIWHKTNNQNKNMDLWQISKKKKQALPHQANKYIFQKSKKD